MSIHMIVHVHVCYSCVHVCVWYVLKIIISSTINYYRKIFEKKFFMLDSHCKVILTVINHFCLVRILNACKKKDTPDTIMYV